MFTVCVDYHKLSNKRKYKILYTHLANRWLVACKKMSVKLHEV